MTARSDEAAGCSAPRSWRLRSAACRPRSFGEVTPLGNILDEATADALGNILR